MTRAAWFFCATELVENELGPLWPAGDWHVGVGATYDCRVLRSGASPADHVHFVRGTRSDDNYELFDVGDRHYHNVQWYDGAWQQITERGTEHDHTFLSYGVRFLPDFFFLFVYGPDAEIVALDADPDWAIVGEVVDGGEADWVHQGDVDDVSANFNPTQWATRLRVAFGIELPSQITTQRRMVNWFGPLCAPNTYDWWTDKAFR